MRTLDRKLLRNLFEMKGQALAIILIITCGVAAFVTVMLAYRGLTRSQHHYYAEYRMADLWAPVERAPRAALRELELVPGVRRVEGRIVFEVTVDLPEMAQPVSARILSVPERRRRVLNDLHLVRGRWFERDGTNQVIVAKRFAREHGLDVGDTLAVVMNNRKQKLRIAALALSPEFVYLIRGTGEILPDPKHFTVLWISQTFAEAVFDMEDAVNEVVATLERGASRDEMIEIFDDRLDRYGALGSYARKDQLSHNYLQNEIDGLKGSATMLPLVFLCVAAFVLHTLMDRLVRTQRGQVAVFRAFGYSVADLGAHFLKLALGIGAAGALSGTLLGVWMAKRMVGLYLEFYSFPQLVFDPDPMLLGAGWAMSLGFAALGALGALRALARIEPAEGLRPEAPAVYHRTWIERVGWLWERLGFATRMAMRDVTRNRLRAAVTAAGVALAASIVFVSFYARDAVEVLIDTQFRIVDRQDLKVAFHTETGRAAIYDLRRLDGVVTAEPELAVPVKLHAGPHRKLTAITGLEKGQTLVGLIDRDLVSVPLPDYGLLLSRKLAEILGVRVGDAIEVEVLNGNKPRFFAPVENVVDEYLGAFAYAEIGTLSRWIGEESAMTGARLAADDGMRAELGRELKELPAVASVADKGHMLRMFRATLAASQKIMNTILILFAGVIMFGVIYNTARISLSERSRELASLRVLGFSRGEVGAILAIENVMLTLFALPFGLALGAWFAWLLSVVYETELFRFPFVVRADSVLWTILLAGAFTLVANLAVQRRVRSLDLIEALKERD